jgi:BirA family transcriptional regulator, biotin operon repressor / biotin---[acetyl-CoA-carboxylase] ligase
LSAEPAHWPDGVGRLVLDEVDSTNAHALRVGGEAPLWVMAGHQTAGRGRRARPWVSPSGNFHATLMLLLDEPPAQVALRSFAAALALREALVELTGRAGAFALKWPNDVLLNGGKLAGILLESSSEAGRARLCIGIGVNLIAAPDPALVEEGALRPVSILGETGMRIAPEDLLDRLAPAFAAWESRLRADGFAPLRAAWLSHAARLGQPIRARTGGEERNGIFQGIDAAGNLILQMPHGAIAIPAADVFF